MTGANELFWYVKQGLQQDRNLNERDRRQDRRLLGAWALLDLILLTLLKQAGSKAKPTATVGLPARSPR